MEISLSAAVVLVISITAFVVFVKYYHKTKAGKPFIFCGIMLTVVFACLLLGNTMPKLISPFIWPTLNEWATVSAFEDGAWGTSHGLFLFVMIATLAIALAIWAFITYKLSDLLGNLKFTRGAASVVFTIFFFLTPLIYAQFLAPVGTNLQKAGIDLLSPTKTFIGSSVIGVANAAIKSGGDLTNQANASLQVANINRQIQALEKEKQDLRGQQQSAPPTPQYVPQPTYQPDNDYQYQEIDPADTMPAVEQYQYIEPRETPEPSPQPKADDQHSQSQKDKKPPLLRFTSPDKQKGPGDSN